MRALQILLLISIGVTTVLATGTPIPCICDDKSLCAPLSTPMASKEIFTFTGSWMLPGDNWKYFDYNTITTLARAGTMDPGIICKAHSTNTRVVLLKSIPPADLPSPTARQKWIADTLEEVKQNYADGINIDYENPIPKGSPMIGYMVTWMQELRAAMKKEMPNAQLSIDVAWSPDCIDVRCYDYAALAKTVDFVFVMDYDMQSQIFGPCVALPNSPIPGVQKGMEAFLKLGIEPNNIVLGVPWYGYRYPCLNPTNDTVCPIKKVPFRGVNCSDAAGKQFPISQILEWLANNKTNGRQWDDKDKAPWFNLYGDDGITYQIRYDDIESLTAKYEYAKKLGLRGTGMWISEDLPLYKDPKFSEEMWKAMRVVL